MTSDTELGDILWKSFQQLLSRRELGDLQGALKGDIIMSLEIEATLECVTAREVPATWAR